MSAYDLLPESTWEFKLVEVDSATSFYTSSVHFDWVSAEEQHIVNDVVKTVRDKGNCGIAIDVGMNDGFYSMLFAALGCEVFSFEIQPRCIDVATSVALKNNFSTHIKVYESPVTARVGESVRVPMGAKSIGSCDGGFSIHVENPGQSAHIPFEQIGARYLRGSQLDDMFLDASDEIAYIKVDTEGHEFDVFQGALALFRERKIEKLVFEASNTLWDDLDRAKLSILDEIIGYGYDMKCSLSQQLITAKDLLTRPSDCGVDIFVERRIGMAIKLDKPQNERKRADIRVDAFTEFTEAISYDSSFPVLAFISVTIYLILWKYLRKKHVWRWL